MVDSSRNLKNTQNAQAENGHPNKAESISALIKRKGIEDFEKLKEVR